MGEQLDLAWLRKVCRPDNLAPNALDTTVLALCDELQRARTELAESKLELRSWREMMAVENAAQGARIRELEAELAEAKRRASNCPGFGCPSPCGIYRGDDVELSDEEIRRQVAW